MRTLGCKLSPKKLSEEVKIPIRASLPKKYRTPAQLPVQDQGSRPWCVPYSLFEILTYRGRLRNRKPQVTHKQIFDSRGDLLGEGMTISEALAFLKGKSEIKSYGRIPSFNMVQSSLIANGPLVIALPVYNYNTEFWKGGSKLLGYHAVSVVGYNENKLLIKNSWGTSYGNTGYSELDILKDGDKILEIWTVLN